MFPFIDSGYICTAVVGKVCEHELEVGFCLGGRSAFTL